MATKNYLITIVGPTAIGKTSLSIQLANHFGCEIISCDSRQFYQEMQVGTAAPTLDELAAAPHHFVHNKSIHDTYTVGDFEREVISKLDTLFQKNNIQILVGGSGLYVNAILNGFDDFPEIDKYFRQQVQDTYELQGLSYLQEQLQQLDPAYFSFLEEENPQTLLNPQRMIRFVEVCLGTEKPYSSFLKQKKNTRNFTPIIIGLEADRQIMYDRINYRVDLMMQSGLLEEVKRLFDFRTLNALQTVGYKELISFINQECDLNTAVEEIKKNTRRFAKRQLTWFKRNQDTIWVNYQTQLNQVIKEIDNAINPN